MRNSKRKGRVCRVITISTPLKGLEVFFNGEAIDVEPQDFAIITDRNRRFILEVATGNDLEDFVRRRLA